MSDELKIIESSNGHIDTALKDAKATSDVVSSYEEITLLNERLHELMDALDAEEKKKRKWQKTFLILLILFLIILLYSCTSFIISKRREVKSYNAVLTANMISVDKSELASMTSAEILEESRKAGYVSNTMEFYYDPLDAKAYGLTEGNTRYYSIASLNSQIRGKSLDYSLTSLVETRSPVNSKTKVANKVFSYGYKDGSSQMAKPESKDLVFSGYSKKLLDNYNNDLNIEIIEEKAVPVVIDASVEVTSDFVEAMLEGVITDNYMANNGETEKSFDIYYGFEVVGSELYYIPSHPVSAGTEYGQVPEKIEVTDLIEKNIEGYLGKDVEVSTKIPLVAKKPTTVIYLSTDNYVYDNFYIASQLELY